MAHGVDMLKVGYNNTEWAKEHTWYIFSVPYYCSCSR